MMRVICLTEMYPNAANAYIGSFVHQQNGALVEKGIEIKVVSPVPWIPFPFSLMEQWGKLKQIPSEEILDGIEVYHPRRPVIPKRFGFHLNGFLYYGAVRHFMKRRLMKFDFDLIHAHVALPDGFAGALLKKGIRKPLVITVHGKDTANAEWSTALRSRSCKEAILKAFRSSSKIVAVSNYVKRSILEFYPSIDPEKIVVIHGGVNLHGSSPPERRPSDLKTILSVGGLIPLKGHRYTIKAMEKVVKIFPKCRLIVVGKGEDRDNLVRQVERAGLQNHVRLLNMMPHDHLLRLMSTCDLFVLPSWAEGLGMVYLEAMALGIPVVGCKGQGIEDVVCHGETGFLTQPKDSEELADLMIKLLLDETLRLRVGQRGQEAVLKNFRWQDNAAKHVALYQSLK